MLSKSYVQASYGKTGKYLCSKTIGKYKKGRQNIDCVIIYNLLLQFSVKCSHWIYPKALKNEYVPFSICILRTEKYLHQTTAALSSTFNSEVAISSTKYIFDNHCIIPNSNGRKLLFINKCSKLL